MGVFTTMWASQEGGGNDCSRRVRRGGGSDRRRGGALPRGGIGAQSLNVAHDWWDVSNSS